MLMLSIDSPTALIPRCAGDGGTVLRHQRRPAADTEPVPTVHVYAEPREMLGRRLDRAYFGGGIEEMFTSVIFVLGNGRATLRIPGCACGAALAG